MGGKALFSGILTGLAVLSLVVTVAAKDTAGYGNSVYNPATLKATMLKNALAGGDLEADGVITGAEDPGGDDSRQGFLSDDASGKGVVIPGMAVGSTVGYTTYDYQHNSRMARQVAWFGDETHNVHFTWMSKGNDVDGPGTYRMTKYQYWKTAGGGNYGYSYTSYQGGKDIHSSVERSGFAGIDIWPIEVDGINKGRAVICNHVASTTIFPDFSWVSGIFSVYRQGIPPGLMTDCQSCKYLWPYHCTQILTTGDTVIHVVAAEYNAGTKVFEIRYFRRVGPIDPTNPGVSWTGMVVDTTPVISHVVEAARPDAPNPNKVAIVWAAHWPGIPGDGESTTPYDINLLVEQNQNDVYSLISEDGGATWGAKHNVSRVDSSQGGMAVLGDINALIDTEGHLHIVWAARPTGNLQSGFTGSSATDWEWPLFPFASRILHASDQYFGFPGEENYISIVKDMTRDWLTPEDPSDDTICFGGAWHQMSLNQPMLSQCDDKLYVLFSQFQDLENGVWDNCHIRNWNGDDHFGSANGLLYFSVSAMASGGTTWDPARPLTGYTQRCDTLGNPHGITDYCHSHFWPSIARYGMEVNPEDNFNNAIIVQDPSWNITSVNHYLDVRYIDDRNPGGVVQGEGSWTYNPVKWFRVPCVDPMAQASLALYPIGVFPPTWGKPSVPYVVPITLTNYGNATLTVNSITPEEIEGPISGWLTVDKTFAVIPPTPPNNYEILTVTINDGGIVGPALAPALLKGKINLTWEGTNTGSFPIEYLVADTVIFPQADTLYTSQISLAVNNAGGAGLKSTGNIGNMNFALALECDECYLGMNNHSETYLFDGSPFVLRLTPTDTLVSAGLHYHDWLSRHPENGLPDGFRPQGTNTKGSNISFNWVRTGIFYSADSTIGMQITYYAPKKTPYNYIGQSIKFFNVSGGAIDDVYLGHVDDWDIPSDSGTRNGSGYDFGRRLMYQFGWETEVGDTFCDGLNDCADADMRFGGSSFIAQFGKTGSLTPTYSSNLHGVFTDKVSEYLSEGHIQYDTLLNKRISLGWSGLDLYTDPNPDSTFMDLMMLSLYGQYDLDTDDTLYFLRTMVSEYQDAGIAPNPTTFLTSVDNARKGMKKAGGCCRAWGFPGDVSSSGTPGIGDHALPDILDIIYIINFKYKEGPTNKWPQDGNSLNGWNCEALMDVNADGAVDILDILYLIAWKFKEDPNAPRCPD